MEHVQLLRVKKLKGCSIINIAARHNLREIQAEIGADSHIDAGKTCLNVIMRGSGFAADIAKEAVSLMEQAKVKPLRTDAVRGLEMVVSLPASSSIDEQAFFHASLAWAEGFFEIPILSAVIHNDEAAPHCHVIMLPLFDGRMIGSGLLGNKTRLIAIQDDFHAKVGQGYGLKRGAPTKRYSRVARTLAADKIIGALRRTPNTLDDPTIRDALRDVLVESMPISLMTLLGLDVPEVKAPIPNKPTSFQSKKPIGFASTGNTLKVQTLSCVGLADNKLKVSPAVPQITNEVVYLRERESEQEAIYWDEVTGEFIKKKAA